MQEVLARIAGLYELSLRAAPTPALVSVMLDGLERLVQVVPEGLLARAERRSLLAETRRMKRYLQG